MRVFPFMVYPFELSFLIKNLFLDKYPVFKRKKKWIETIVLIVEVFQFSINLNRLWLYFIEMSMLASEKYPDSLTIDLL